MKRRLALLVAPLLTGFGGAALGSVALFSVGVGIVALYAGALGAVRIAARRVDVERTLDRTEVVEGRPVTLRFGVSGMRALPVHVEVRGADGGWWALPPAGGTASLVIDRPGPHVVGATALRVRDDLGLFSRGLRAGRAVAVLVLPEPAPTAEVRRRGGADPVGDPEPDGLRPYVPGTAMSRIHWASEARGGELQERAFATARDRLPLVVVDTAGTAEDAAVDWAARQAAGQVLALVRAGGCRVVLPGDRAPTIVVDPTAQWPALHRRLAALEPGVVGRPATGDEPGTSYVRAAQAPEGTAPRGPLPPGVVALADRDAAGPGLVA